MYVGICHIIVHIFFATCVIAVHPCLLASLEGWFTDLHLYDFKDFIEKPPEFLVKEEKIRELTEEVKIRVLGFVQSLSSLDHEKQVITDIL